jgi:RNA polymerase sigma factor (TIGR02999 family)
MQGFRMLIPSLSPQEVIQLLVDWGNGNQVALDIKHARRHTCAKRGGGAGTLALDETALVSQTRVTALLGLDEALARLATIDLRKSRVVELWFFGGLSVEEAARVLHIAPNTVLRDWRMAKAWLRCEISHEY